MADKTGIEWTEATWNPIVGCSIVSPGCTNCYAMKMADRFEAMIDAHTAKHGGDPGPMVRYQGTTTRGWYGTKPPVWTGKVALAPDHIVTQPLRWRRPRTIFVNSMGDLFHEDVPDEWIDRVFAVMALSPQHTFQVLTKRAKRMREYFAAEPQDRWNEEAGVLVHWDDMPQRDAGPLPNVWLGVSAEDQARADERIPDLLATPAAVRFVSAEPLLGPMDLYDGDPDPRLGGLEATNAYLGEWWEPGDDPSGPPRHGVDWIIVGGESGPGARPMHPDWARSIRDQCAVAGVPYFFKQWGEWHPDALLYTDAISGERPPSRMKVGKKRAGALLDGREHREMPEVNHG